MPKRIQFAKLSQRVISSADIRSRKTRALEDVSGVVSRMFRESQVWKEARWTAPILGLAARLSGEQLCNGQCSKRLHINMTLTVTVSRNAWGETLIKATCTDGGD